MTYRGTVVRTLHRGALRRVFVEHAKPNGERLAFEVVNRVSGYQPLTGKDGVIYRGDAAKADAVTIAVDFISEA